MYLHDTLLQTQSKKCIIEIFGLGYVGFPLSIRLATSGFKVVGVDIDSKRIERIQNNILNESELIFRKEFLESSKNGNFEIAKFPAKSDSSKIGIICVPTPIPKQNIDSNVFVKSAVEDFLNICKSGDVIIIESSVKVGTTDEMRAIIERSGFKVGENFGLCFCPERIDPLNQKWTLENIPRVIYASDDITFRIAENVYHYVNNSSLKRVESAKVAEVVKSFENAFRLVNISLVNELAVLCDKLEINVNDVINAAATKPFGFMPFYPSAGVGGHCIPKDPRFLLESARISNSEFMTIEAALKINSFMPKYIVDSIESTLDKLKIVKSVLVCGLTYKPDIEDMRDSPGFKIINELQKRNFRIAGYDPYYKKDMRERYLIANELQELNFEEIDSLDDDLIRNFNCICIVQHHAKTRFRLTTIYQESLVPFIYDCQKKLAKDPKSKTILNVHNF